MLIECKFLREILGYKDYMPLYNVRGPSREEEVSESYMPLYNVRGPSREEEVSEMEDTDVASLLD